MPKDAAIREKVNVGADANPFRLFHDDGTLDTDQAAAFLREHGYQVSGAGLIGRRTTGKSPAFLKIGMAVRYREVDLRGFLKSVGLSTRGFDEPKSEKRVLESRLRNGRK